MSLNVHPDEIVAESRNGLLAKHHSWDRIQVGEFTEIKNGFAFDSKRFNSRGTGVPLIRIRDVGSDASDTFYDGEFDDTYWVEPGDLVIGMDGNFRIARWKGPRSLLNQRVCRLRVVEPRVYDDRFLEHVLPGYLDAIHERTSSVTVKHLSSRTVADIPVPRPPLDEQQRIAEAIEEQFSRLDAGVESLQRAKRNLARIRGAAVRSLFDIEWPTVPLGEVSEVVGGITKDAKRESDPYTVEIPYLRVANVQRGYLDLKEVKTIRAPLSKLKSLLLKPGDVLLTEGGDRDKLGRGCVWKGELDRCIHQNHIFRARFNSNRFVPEFVSMYANNFGQKWFERMGKQTTNLASISLTALQKFPLPFPAIEEQRRVVVEVERQFSIIDSMATTIDAGLQRAAALRHSILSQAFTGGLTRSSEPKQATGGV